MPSLSSSRTTWVALCAGALLASSVRCSPDGAAGGGAPTILELGSGPSNAEPLLVLRAGIRHEASDLAIDDQHVDKSLESGGTSLISGPFDRGFGEPVWEVENSIGLPSYLAQRADGIYRVDDGYGGKAAAAQLIVPATVRVGMRWSCSDGNGDTLEYSVASVTSKPTIYGARNVWEIDFKRGAGGTAHISGTYVEGRGLNDGNGFVVFPFDDPPAAPAYPPVNLTPLNDGKPVARQFRGLNVSAHLDSSADPKHPWRLRFGGWSPSVVGGAVEEELSVHCGRTDGTTFLEEAQPWDYQGNNEQAFQNSYLACPDAAAVAFDAKGAVQHGRNDYDGIPVAYQLADSGADQNFLPMLAMFGGFGGTPTVLMATTGSTWGRALSLGDADPSTTNIDHATERIPTRRQNVLRRGLLSNVERAIVADVAPGATETGAILAARGRLLEARITADGVDGVQALASNEARYSTTASPTARTHLLVSPDGRIDRVHLAPSGTTFEPLALVPLQSHETLVGALMLDATHLTVLLERDYTGVAGLTLSTLQYGVYAASATLGTPSAAAPPSVLSSLQGDLSGDDVVLCVRKGAGPWSTIGWKIHGVATKAVVAGDRCLVVLGTPRPAGPLGGQPGGIFTVEGPVPGSGRVEVSIVPGRESVTPVVATPGLSSEYPAHASLAEGGFTSDTQRYTDGAIYDGDVSVEFQASVGARTIVDAAGHGFWLASPKGSTLSANVDSCAGAATCADLVLLGAKPKRLRVGLPTAATPGVSADAVAPVGGGGVILAVGTAYAVVGADGTAKMLPAGRQYVGGTANGTFCGYMLMPTLCPSAHEAESPDDPEAFGAAGGSDGSDEEEAGEGRSSEGAADVLGQAARGGAGRRPVNGRECGSEEARRAAEQREPVGRERRRRAHRC